MAGLGNLKVQNIVNNLTDEEISQLDPYALGDMLSGISAYAQTDLALAIETAGIFMTTFGNNIDSVGISQSKIYKKLKSEEKPGERDRHINSVNYCGPDRRLQVISDYTGPFRRSMDMDRENGIYSVFGVGLTPQLS